MSVLTVSNVVGPETNNRGFRRPNSKGLMIAKKIYVTIIYLQDRATAENLVKYTGLSRSTVYYHLKRLVERGFVGKERVNSKVMYRMVRPLNAVELTEEIDRIPGEGTVCILARLVKKLMEVYGIEGDLIGSSKIHIEAYPQHIAVFPVIEVVVVKEHALVLANLLVNYLNATVRYVRKYRAIVVKPLNIPGGVTVYLRVDRIYENGRVLWKLRNYIKKYKGLTVEHAVAADLIKIL